MASLSPWRMFWLLMAVFLCSAFVLALRSSSRSRRRPAGDDVGVARGQLHQAKWQSLSSNVTRVDGRRNVSSVVPSAKPSLASTAALPLVVVDPAAAMAA